MRVNLFFNKKDLYFNFDNQLSNMIIVTGMSGSGKSSLSKELKKIYDGYEIVSFDRLFDFEEERQMNELESILIKEFKKENTDTVIENNEYMCNKFHDFVLDYIDKHNLKIIFDGSYFLDKIDFEKIKTKQIVLKRTSYILSLIRRTKRNFVYILNHNYSFVRILKEIHWLNSYNIKHLKKWFNGLNDFYKKINEIENV